MPRKVNSGNPIVASRVKACSRGHIGAIKSRWHPLGNWALGLATVLLFTSLETRAAVITNCSVADLNTAVLGGDALVTFACSGTIRLTNGFVIGDELTIEVA